MCSLLNKPYSYCIQNDLDLLNDLEIKGKSYLIGIFFLLFFFFLLVLGVFLVFFFLLFVWFWLVGSDLFWRGGLVCFVSGFYFGLLCFILFLLLFVLFFVFFWLSKSLGEKIQQYSTEENVFILMAIRVKTEFLRDGFLSLVLYKVSI